MEDALYLQNNECATVTETNEFSVLMSVYFKEQPEHFDECLKSLLEQTVQAGEWVIVKDGAISPELQAVIDKYKSIANIKEVPLENNMGLGIALSIGIKECSNELVARMDTDDIAVSNRFELQLEAFEQHGDLDICGGQIVEFETTPDEIIGERRVPLTHEEIVQYQKKRCAFNHMTVMYKKSKVIESGNYKNVPLMEDDTLWVDMILNGAKTANLNENLCFVRTDRNMIARRGGLKYFNKYKRARRLILKKGFISRSQYFKTNLIQFAVCIMPSWMRKKIYFGLLHKKTKRANAQEKPIL